MKGSTLRAWFRFMGERAIGPQGRRVFVAGVATRLEKCTRKGVSGDVSDDIFPDLLAAVEQQLESPQTRYVAATFTRLQKAGLTDDQAKQQIALCLGEEMERVLKTKRGFDERTYRAALGELPLPDEADADVGSPPP